MVSRPPCVSGKHGLDQGERRGAGGDRTLLRERGGEIPERGMPRLRSDNGSCYMSQGFRWAPAEHGLGHQWIKPHCPEENGITER